MNKTISAAIVFWCLGVGVWAADWPTYRADAARSGYTPEPLPEDLALTWVRRAAHPPMPAWPSRNRQRYDRADQPVIAGGTVYFGSSADGKVYALDAPSGRVRWTFFTDGPVRFAPAVWQDRVFVAGDDGWLYALAAADGEVLWKFRGGPRADMLLGNRRMISRWPARGGPVVADAVVYFGAGIWPSEGIFIYAIDPSSGEVLWSNDSSGGLEMDQPHSTARAKSGISAQGYLAVCGDALLVPTGRAVPAVFDRSGSKLRYFRLQQNQHLGGSDVAAVGDHFFNGGAIFALHDGTFEARIGVEVAAHPDFIVTSAKNTVIGHDRKRLLLDKEVTDRRGQRKIVKVLAPPAWNVTLPYDTQAAPTGRGRYATPANVMGSTAWSRPHREDELDALIVAGDKIVAGGRDAVWLVDLLSQRVAWSAEVDGNACGLAVADGRLFVSTDRGALYCFGSGGRANPEVPPAASQSAPGDGKSGYAAAAQEIIRRTGVTEGYCLDLGCGEGRLALELARRTRLQIYAVDRDPAKVAAARRMLDAAGLYGVRVTVHQANPAKLPYPNWFADLVVSGRSVMEGPAVVPAGTLPRFQRPDGGVVCLGRPGAMRQSVRGALPGAGSWTHQHSDAANTLCSGDDLLHGPLAMLWFRDTDFVLPNRHGRGPAPLVAGGRMFVEGIDALRATNLYNGRTLWEFPLEGILLPCHREHSIGAAWTGSNVCLGADQVYVHTGDRCLRLDAATGRKRAEWAPPPRPDGKPGTWGFIACEGNILFGSLVREEYLVKCWSPRWDTGGQFTESLLLFAMHAQTGKLLWTFTPEHSIRHNTIAIGGGRVYLIDRPPAPADDVRFNPDRARAEAQRRAAANGTSQEEESRRLGEHRPGRAVALDRETGEIVWRTGDDAFGTMLAYSAKHDLLLMGYQAVHQASRESERGDRLAAIRARDGTRAWDVRAEYVSRPILNDAVVYAQPGAWDLLTGRRLPFTLERSYGCGIPAGSKRMLVFRSATLGYVDLTGKRRTENYGGIRPGCWINAIPAGGLLLMADAASWCTCSYLNQATVALQPLDAEAAGADRDR